jgi:hypothetical protein
MRADRTPTAPSSHAGLRRSQNLAPRKRRHVESKIRRPPCGSPALEPRHCRAVARWPPHSQMYQNYHRKTRGMCTKYPARRLRRSSCRRHTRYNSPLWSRVGTQTPPRSCSSSDTQTGSGSTVHRGTAWPHRCPRGRRSSLDKRRPRVTCSLARSSTPPTPCRALRVRDTATARTLVHNYIPNTTWSIKCQRV